MSDSEGFAGGGFVPNEDLVSMLLNMGVSRNAAIKGLYYTGNSNADMAASWIFEHSDEDLDSPLIVDEANDDGEENFPELMAEGMLDASKMVFVVNTSLGMGVGKVAAQVAHAALGLHHLLLQDAALGGPLVALWEESGATKIVLRGDSAQQLEDFAMQAESLQLCHFLVNDAGRTQVAAGSTTVLGVFGPVGRVDQVTGSLQLL